LIFSMGSFLSLYAVWEGNSECSNLQVSDQLWLRWVFFLHSLQYHVWTFYLKSSWAYMYRVSMSMYIILYKWAGTNTPMLYKFALFFTQYSLVPRHSQNTCNHKMYYYHPPYLPSFTHPRLRLSPWVLKMA
jgi:hypothetical protein